MTDSIVLVIGYLVSGFGVGYVCGLGVLAVRKFFDTL